MSQFFSHTFWRALLVIGALYIFGLLGYLTSFSGLILVIIALASVYLSYKHLDKALYLVFIELFSNPHGVLVQTDVSGFTVSLRMAIFAGVMTGWGIGWLTKRYKPVLKDGRAQIFLFLVLAAFVGLIIGVLSRDPSAVFSDGNAYLYLLYLLPILSISWTHTHRHELLQILTAGALWVAGLSFVLLFIFSHFGEGILQVTYYFFRDLRVAEITALEGGAYRIFLQSQVFTILFGWILLAMTSVAQKKGWIISLGTVVFAVVLLALSRSFWVGLFVAVVFLLVLLYRSVKPSFKTVARFTGFGFLTVVLSILLLVSIALFPFPGKGLTGASLVDSLKDRTTDSQDVGISSRWNLLTPMLNEIFESPLLGHGFGKSVTFETDDPRAREINPDGTWTTVAMEWGWLELWLKMGVLGPIGFLYAGYELTRRLWAYTWTQQAWLGYALVTGIVFLFATHFFSPYLNHPIGLGYLLFLIPFLSLKKQPVSSSTVFIEEIFSAKQPVGVMASRES